MPIRQLAEVAAILAQLEADPAMTGRQAPDTCPKRIAPLTRA